MPASLDGFGSDPLLSGSSLHRKAQLGSFLSEAQSGTVLDYTHHVPLLAVKSPRVPRGHRELQSFLSSLTEAAERVPAQRGEHEDFLFGSPGIKISTSVPGRAVGSRSRPFELPTPTFSMLPAFTTASTAASSFCEEIGKQMAKVEPFSDGKQGEETGFCKFVPRFLRISFWYDVLAAGVLGHALLFTCDVPLRIWLLGGLGLSFPLSNWIHDYTVKNTHRYESFKLTVTALRGGGDPTKFRIEELIIFSRLGNVIHRSTLDKYTTDNHWVVSIRDYEDLIIGYKIVTSRHDSPETDPASWILEGSSNGRDWTLIDEVEGEDLPRERGAESEKFDDLLHIPDAVAGFRRSFLVEVAACTGSFVWLVLGTSWVSAGSETCLDSAPLLWYWSYLGVVVTWSFVGTITIGLIVSAVVMVILGAKSPSQAA